MNAFTYGKCLRSAVRIVLVASFAGGSLHAQAATCTWNTATGNWATIADWLTCGTGNGNPGGTPGSNDSVGIGATGVVTINTAQSVLNLNNAGQINIDAFVFTLVGGGSTVNTGTINVGAGPNPNNAALNVSAGHNINNTGGVINISADSVLNQFGSTITGGTINTTGTGAIVAFLSGSNVLDGVTLNGTLDLTSAGNARERIVNGLTLNGAVNIANGGIMSIDPGSQAVGGAGTINLNDAGARLALEGNGTTTLASTVVVRGQGNIGQAAIIAGTNNLVNNGRISADVNGGTLTIVPGAGGGSMTNNNLIDARNGGTLQLSGVTVSNSGGLINAQNNSVVLQNGSAVVGGTISSAGSGVFRAVLSNSNVLDGVTLSGVLDLTNAGNARERIVNGLTLAGGSVNIANGGILSIDNAATGAAQTIGGTGTINLNDGGARLALEGNFSTTIGSNVVVRGQGNIGTPNLTAGTNNLVNNGRISADVNGGTLNIVPGASGGNVTNNGILEAVGGGTLMLSTNVIGNTGSQIAIDASSKVVQNGVTVSGVINTTGAGLFQAVFSTANFLDGVTLNGTLDLTGGNARERVINGLTLNGAINIANGGILSMDSPNTAGGNQTLGGNATINLNDGGARLALEGSGTTTLASTVVVRGQGNIGTPLITAGTNNLVNNGRISADVNGGTLNIVPGASGGNVTNNGILEAVGGGTLMLSTNVIGNAGSQIAADASSKVVQNGVTVSGVINVTGAGLFQAVFSTANFLDGVTLNGTLDLTGGNARERVINGLTLNGAINIANGGILSMDSPNTAGGNQTLGGNATINLNDGGALLALEGNGTTTLASTVVVRGQGNIGTPLIAAGTNNLVNNGRISADVNGATLAIRPGAGNGTVTNNNLIDARGGGTLQLANVTVNNASLINAQNGSVVLQSNSVVSGGTIGSTGSGVFRADSSGGNVLDAVTLNGVLDMTAGNARERLVNGLTLAGGSNINIANGGIVSVFGGNQTVAGTGTINMNDGGARLALEGNGTTTLASGVVVRGQGNIGTPLIAAGTNNLVNNGRISADVNGGTLTITPGAGNGTVTNNSLIDARGGGTLQLANVTVNNASLINAQNGSVVLQSNSTVSGGTIGSTGSGVFRADGNTGNVLDAVTLSGVLDITNAGNARERLVNGLTLAGGSVNVANGGILSVYGGNQTVAGTGTINLNDGGARLTLEGNGTTTLASGVVVRGQGNIGTPVFVGGTNNLVNQGTILADGGTLTIAPGAFNGGFANDGLVHASTGTVTIQPALTGTGTLQVDATGVANLANSPNTQGKLVMGAAGSTLNIGTQNLTITNDYTNVASGSGNTFDRRAGVSGAGLIVAGGDVAQVITGANVTNGNTANATLTIGNVHVGANAVDYQIANIGTTGPTLRGAIQTNVNGANLTDSRLSGSGVTAGNYNTGGPGSNTGNLGVTFTAASAGALAPLTGQVLNLTSNFANIADQKLNIMLGSGAAAYNLAAGSTAAVTVANQRVGGTNTGALTVSNTAPSGSFTEALNASFASGSSTGAVTSTSGSITGGTGSGVPGQGSNSTAMTVGIDTTSSGAKSGTLTVNYVSNGTGSSGLGNTAVGSQIVNVTGNVYQAAAGAIQTAALNFGNVQAGTLVTQNLVVKNTAVGASGFVEDLNASFATGTGTGTGGNLISGTGNLNGIVAGANSTGANGTMTVSVNTGSAGTINGNIAVNYFTAGAVNGVLNGLGTALVGSENYGVAGTIQTTGNVIDQAKPVINGVANPSAVTVNLGNVRINGSAGQTLTVLNQATGNQQAALNASIVSNGAPVTASGGFTGLLPGNTSPGQASIGTLQVGINTSVAGARSGSATVSLVSDITAFGNCNPCTLNLPDQTVNVNANVFRLATGSASVVPVDLGAFRVGVAAPAGANLSVTNTAAADGFSEQLGIQSVSSGNGLFTATNTLGSTRVNAGATAANAVAVGAGSGLAAGVNTGSVTVHFLSDGTVSGTGSPIASNSQQFDVTAKGYTPAVGQLVSPAGGSLNFGTVRVGTAVAAQDVTITNGAASTALNDTLRGTLAVAGAGFTGDGATVGGLGAGQSNGAGTLQVGFDTSTAGVKSGTAQVGFKSEDPDLAALDLSPSSLIGLSGTVNALANPLFSQSSGSGGFSCSGGVCTLNFGTLVEGSGTSTNMLMLQNLVSGPADDLLGGFDFGLLGSFGEAGFGAVDLAPLGELDNLALFFDATTVGNFSGGFTFNGLSHNAFQNDYALGPIQFVLEANVVAQGGNVPEPGTLWLMLLSLVALAYGASSRRRFVRR